MPCQNSSQSNRHDGTRAWVRQTQAITLVKSPTTVATVRKAAGAGDITATIAAPHRVDKLLKTINPLNKRGRPTATAKFDRQINDNESGHSTSANVIAACC